MPRNLQAVLFDCDGVLAETERDGHRVCYNLAFEREGVDAHWSVGDYAGLVRIAGGKERLRAFFAAHPEKYPPAEFGQERILRLYRRKTEIFREMAAKGRLKARPGIPRLIRELHESGVLLFVCSTSHRESVEALLRANLGETGIGWFADLLCGDIVPHKKPAPDIYRLAVEKHALGPARCVVVEDSRNGLLAALGAGLHCLITTSFYTSRESFAEADAAVSTLGDPGGPRAECLKKGPMAVSGGFVSEEDLEALVSAPAV